MGVGKIPVGDASRGLCGGMVLAAADYWAAGRLPPSTSTAPAATDPLWRYLVRRQVDSLRLPQGVLRYVALMHPALPRAFLDRRLRQTAWPAVKTELDHGRLCPLGLVMVRSIRPWRAVEHHQVLAWDYRMAGVEARIAVYDPNRPGDDEVVVVWQGPSGVRLVSKEMSEPIVTFFPVRWAPRSPPSLS